MRGATVPTAFLLQVLLACTFQYTALCFTSKTRLSFPCTQEEISTNKLPTSFDIFRLEMKQTNSKEKEIDSLAKVAWYGVEQFGNLFGKKKQGEAIPINLESSPQSTEETLQRIQDDFDRSYFLSGEVDEKIYDEQCTFRDPFVSFQGKQRFIDNLANLGSFITRYSVRPLTFEQVDSSLVLTKVRHLF